MPFKEVRCYDYSAMRVKVLDDGEKGGTLISATLYRSDARRPACGKQDDPGEKMLMNGEGRNFDGARGSFFQLGSVDSGPAGNAFSIDDGRTGRSLYEDNTTALNPTTFSVSEGVLTLGYRRGIGGTCSILTHGASCWTKIAKEAQLPPQVASQPPPVAACEAGYATFARAGEHPSRDDPSTVSYEVTVRIDGGEKPTVLSRGALQCDPNTM